MTLNSWIRNGKKARMRAGHWQSPPSIGSLHRGTGQASCALPTQHWPVLNPRLPWLEASCGWPLPTMHMLTLKLWGPSCTPFPPWPTPSGSCHVTFPVPSSCRWPSFPHPKNLPRPYGSLLSFPGSFLSGLSVPLPFHHPPCPT